MSAANDPTKTAEDLRYKPWWVKHQKVIIWTSGVLAGWGIHGIILS